MTQPLDHLVQACERFVAESLFADLFPDLLDRVHLRGVWRDECKVNVLRDLKPVRPVPSGSVTNQEQLIIRIRLCHLMQKHIHTSSITIRQYKKESITGPCFYRSVRIPVFPYMVTWHGRPHSFLAPAVLRLVDPPESRFILEQQPYSLFGEFPFQVVVTGFNFFEALTASLSADFGCLDLGRIFRHPCRFSNR